MPIIYQQDIDAETKIGVWKIEEHEDFFLEKVMPQRAVSHPHKKLQHLAGRYLLSFLFPHFPVDLIRVADTYKPFLDNDSFHFSISHCGDFAAAVVSGMNRVGVDAELVREKIDRIRHKFMNEEENKLLERWVSERTNEKQASDSRYFTKRDYATMVWCCKEAVYKWYGHGEVDFRSHMHIKSVIQGEENHFDSILLFNKNEEIFFDLHSVFMDDLCITWVST